MFNESACCLTTCNHRQIIVLVSVHRQRFCSLRIYASPKFVQQYPGLKNAAIYHVYNLNIYLFTLFKDSNSALYSQQGKSSKSFHRVW